MSRSTGEAADGKASTAPVGTTGQPLVASATGLARGRKLLVITAIAFAIWIAALLAMYFTTVYPLRYPSTPSVPSTPPSTSV